MLRSFDWNVTARTCVSNTNEFDAARTRQLYFALTNSDNLRLIFCFCSQQHVGRLAGGTAPPRQTTPVRIKQASLNSKRSLLSSWLFARELLCLLFVLFTSWSVVSALSYTPNNLRPTVYRLLRRVWISEKFCERWTFKLSNCLRKEECKRTAEIVWVSDTASTPWIRRGSGCTRPSPCTTTSSPSPPVNLILSVSTRVIENSVVVTGTCPTLNVVTDFWTVN